VTPRPFVLVADDAPDISQLVRIALERGGFEVLTVEDGDAALQAVADRQPDVVVLDVWMPGVDGVEVVRRLRADPATAALPILVLTAAIHGSTIDDARAAGADAAMHKPFRPPALVAQVRALLSPQAS
jgi:two-component system phosphate regulon response regulator PhoB